MNKYISILIIILFANSSFSQNKNYSELWDAVEKLEVQGLPKSALKALQPIETKAEKENNSPQQIKIMLFKSKFSLLLEEEAQLKIINDFKTKITKTQAPTKNVLENILATLYWQYFQQNRYKFYNRTKTKSKVDNTDFRTWDLETLFNQVHQHYKNALNNGLVLQQTSLVDFDVLLTLQNESKTYRPTLYDFLAHNALIFYKHKESRITKPAYKFTIDNTDYLAKAETFSNSIIVSKDSSSLELNALKLFKELTKFHLKNKAPFALTAVNIERLRFVNEHATFSNKETIYINTLKAESKKHTTHEVSTLYDFELARIYSNQANKYDAIKNTNHQWKNKEAVAICDAAITKFPKSKGAKKCKILIQNIKRPRLQILTETLLPVQTEARILVSYSNLNTLKLAAFKLSEKQYNTFSKLYKENEQHEFIVKLNAEKTWDETLKNENDYQTHRTELVLPKLNNNRYLITAKTSEIDKKFKAHTLVQITNIALVEYEDDNNHFYQFINRNNGKPFANATIKLQFKNRNKTVKTQTITTDTKGKIAILKKKNDNRILDLKIETKNDTAYFNNIYINNYYRYGNNNNDSRANAFIFTDRSIYRPGQTVFFKSIVMKTQNEKSEVLAEENVFVILNNVNGEEVKRLELVTNTFGSVAGEFILPNNGLTGNFSIRVLGKKTTLSYSQTSFSVEDYKRPKFETNFKPITETIKINDSVKVTGEALAFAGAKISNAKVVYRVKRNVQYPRWCYWAKPSFQDQGQEITQGKTTTDANGNYHITFKALPNKTANKNNLPIFKYEIIADVTDINGETRSASTIVNVGYHALTASVSINASLNKTNKNHEMAINTRNLNGEFVPAKGTVKIYKLQAPSNVLRPRPWAAPDYKTLTETDFKNRFPNDAYTNEDKSENWKKGKLVFNNAFNTETSKTLALGTIKKWNSGEYIVVLETKDKFGQLVKDEVKTNLFSEKDNLLADNKLFSIKTNKTDYKANETAVLEIATAAKNITVTVAIEKDQKITDSYIILLNKNKKNITIPVTTKDIGGFVVHYSFAAFNSFKSGTQKINVPYPSTDLEIETLTFRDKLQPGNNETWKFIIKGPKGDKVAAELLASMYDMSLNEFKPHNWNFNPISNSNYYSNYSRNANKSFEQNNFTIRNSTSYSSYPSSQNYDRLNWFGLSFRSQNYYRKKSPSQASDIYIETVTDDLELEEVLPQPMVTASPNASFSQKLQGQATGLNISSGSPGGQTKINLRGVSSQFDNVEALFIVDGIAVDKDFLKALSQKDILSINVLKNNEAIAAYGIKAKNGVIIITTKNNSNTNFNNIKIRKNLQETAFFFPQLTTDTSGNVAFSFTTPEALTKWKLQLVAHTKTLKNATTALTTVTQKELMVLPNVPRFLREGDQIKIATKISNLTDKQLKGVAVLQLFDALTGKPIDNKLSNANNQLNFSVNAKGNTSVTWDINVADNVQAVQYKIIAKSGNFSDGEQNTLPVLTNRMLVTESVPIWIRSNQTKTFTLNKLKTNTSTTLKNHKLTLEITSNPAWYAVQALPYLMEYPYQCNEQTFSRYYANALARHIANANPKIQEVFNQWKNTGALLSNLEKNQELKSILIQETPWLRDAQSETEQKKRIAILFDLNKMNNELSKSIKKLKQNQMSSGAWSWFGNYRENRYITQHIITGFGHLKKLNIKQTNSEQLIINKALNYLDAEFVKEYKDITKYNAKADLNTDRLSYSQLQFMYMRSFFPNNKPTVEVKNIMAYYHTQIKKYWLNRPLYAKGLMALVTHRRHDDLTAAKILKSLQENSITSNELGMYWKENTNSWYWYQAPIETQALMIEAFSEAGTVIQNKTKNLETINELKIWLLKNKQTNRWKTTKATTEAIYALLLQGSDWLSVTNMVNVSVGNKPIAPLKLEAVKVEAGTGYYKTNWSETEITPEMADVKITKKGNGIAWGSLYWQYFEDLDKITSAETPLKLKKKLFKKTNTDKGEVITDITKNTKIEVGDLIRVRIELRSDRAMEYVHMKDMRAAGLEPVNVLSRYKYQDGLGYYEATKDASTNFFFDYLPKGIYVFEYDLRVSNSGNMSNGITTIQSMYAPEFTSHSEGLRITVK